MKRWVFYILYICAALVFFLYYLFPSNAARDFLAFRLTKSLPDYQVAVAQIKPVFPPGIRLRNVDVLHKDQAWAALDQLTVRPNYITLLSDKKEFNFNGAAYGGEVSGTLDWGQNGAAAVVELNADLRNIGLGDIAQIQEAFGRKVLGDLTVDLRYRDSGVKDQKADIRLTLSDCSVEIAHPLLNIGIDQMTFKTVDAVVAVDKQTLELKQCRAVGTQADADLSGTIRFRRPFNKSLLDFRGTLKLHHTLLANMKNVIPGGFFQQRKNESGGLPVKLYGTIDNPKFSFR